MPKDYAEMQAMVSYATYSLTGPVAIRYPKIIKWIPIRKLNQSF